MLKYFKSHFYLLVGYKINSYIYYHKILPLTKISTNLKMCSKAHSTRSQTLGIMINKQSTIFLQIIQFKSNFHFTHIITNLMLNFLVFLTISTQLFQFTQQTTPQHYCSAYCIDYIGACDDITGEDCIVCSTDLFSTIASDQDDTDVTKQLCAVLPQTTIMFQELNTTSMDLTGYLSDTLTENHCLNYTLSGAYVAGSYLYKNFTNIPTNHYEIVIRFGVAYLGSWAATDGLTLAIDGTDYTWSYSCGTIQNLCSSAGTDCMSIKNYIVQHNTSFVTLSITSSITQTDPSIQNWGIKDLIIGIKTCNMACQTCTGPLDSDCLSCAIGYYLSGNICVQQCSMFYSQTLRKCFDSCPLRYYQVGLLCQPCQNGCIICESSSSCILSDNSTNSSGNNNSNGSSNNSGVNQTIYLWVAIGILSAIVGGFILFKIIQFLISFLKPQKISPAQNEIQLSQQSQIDLDNNSKKQQKVLQVKKRKQPPKFGIQNLQAYVVQLDDL